MFTPYIQAFPAEEAMFLLPILKGHLPEDYKKAVHAGVNLINYGLGQTIGENIVVAEMLAATDPVMALERSLTERASVGGGAMSSIPWAELVRILLPLLLDWVKSAG